MDWPLDRPAWSLFVVIVAPAEDWLLLSDERRPAAFVQFIRNSSRGMQTRMAPVGDQPSKNRRTIFRSSRTTRLGR
jgi:hypothetical protein